MSNDDQVAVPSEVTFTDKLQCLLIDGMGNDRALAEAAWVSTSEDIEEEMLEQTKTDQDVEGLLRYLMRHKHGTPFEHGALKFLVRAPLFVWREHHRHRIGFSYNEESARYKVLKPEFYIARKARVQTGKPGHYKIAGGSADQTAAMQARHKTMAYLSYEAYLDELNEGIAREQAREVLSVNIMSSCYVTCNPRSLMKFLELRAAPTAQAEIRALAETYAVALSDLFPVAYSAFMENGRIAP